MHCRDMLRDDAQYCKKGDHYKHTRDTPNHSARDDPENDLALESYAITVGNVYKVVDIWSGPSNEAIMKFWENPNWNTCPYDEIMEGEFLESAVQIFSSKK